ncbi:MAG: radical SAM protein [Desulfobacteraceae bacterium]
MPDILLIQPPIHDFYLTAKRTLPYGLASIAASLRKAGLSVEILDALATPKSRIIAWPGEMAYLEPFFGRSDRSPFGLFHTFRHFGYSLEHIANQARRSGAFLIGISSLFSAYSAVALETASIVKRTCPQAFVVLGGHHPTAMPEQVMQHPAVDFVLRGDGEIGLPLLARALQQALPLDGIPGLVQRCDDGTFSIRPPAVADDLDRLPQPALDLIRWSHYQRAGQAGFALSAGRGCPLKCSYCSVNTNTYHGFRLRGVERIVAELASVNKRHRLGFVDFEDEHLCADRDWFSHLLTAIRNRFGQRPFELRAMNGLFAPALSRRIIQQMQQSGFKTLNLALITTCALQLKRFRRPNITAALDRVLSDSMRSGLNCVVYIIVAGPGQRPEQSVDDLIHLAQRRVLAGVSIFYPSPGSDDYEWCRGRHMLPDQLSLLRATAMPLEDHTSRLAAVTLLRLGRVLNFMKLLIDQGNGIPQPGAPEKLTKLPESRLEIGRMLLAGFLNDGLIRGVDSDGKLYAHLTDSKLCMMFLERLRRVKLMGSRVV